MLKLATLCLAQMGPLAQPSTAANQPVHDAALAPNVAAIPFDQVGAVAGKQYSGDGLAVASNPGGASLRCAFQRLNAKVTTEGLWLVSTKEGTKGEPFRVVARALGRAAVEPLAVAGRVEMAGQIARFLRPGLTEEYSVGIDGLRQDFVIERRPPGEGYVRLELEVDGAKAEGVPGGARLVLADGGRRMVYNRFRATDAQGKELFARVEVASAHRLVVVLDDAGAEYPVRIDPTFSDANWVSLGGLPGVDGSVYAAAVDNAGNLYIGGSFSFAGGVVANNIAEWNGSSWLALGSGMDAPVDALVVSGTNVFVGGYFTTAGGVTANNIAQWNGTSWSALGSGITGSSVLGNGPAVYALAVSGTNLFAGGPFTTAGGVTVNNIARWNGSSWSALGSGVDDWVEALAVSSNQLFAGGYFTNAGGASANYIALWDGASWSALGSGISGRGTEGRGPGVFALAVLGNNLIVGGEFTNAGGTSASCIAQWNGNSWSALGSGISGDVDALAVSGTNLFAGGAFSTAGGESYGIVEWNGSSWSALSTGAVGVLALAATGGNLFVGGNFSQAGGVSAMGIAQWNGSSWLGSGPGLNGSASALAVLGNNLVAGGDFTTAGGLSANHVAKWNGSSWLALGTGISGTNDYGLGPTVSALAASGSNLYVGGVFGMAGGVTANNIALWNGSSWSALGTGILGTNDYGSLPGVSALAVSGSNVYVGGVFGTAGGVSANNIAQWNGNSWSALGSGISGPQIVLGTSASYLLAPYVSALAASAFLSLVPEEGFEPPTKGL